MSTFNTERFKELVSYAIRGAGFNKLLELSSYMGIKVDNGTLYLNTTDGTNYMRVSDACVADNLDVTVNADLFAKLISRINTDTVDIEVVDNVLVVKSNGTYKLEIVPDENGAALSFPDKFPAVQELIDVLSASEVVTITSTIKASLSNNAGSVYSSYYFGDVVASTDKSMASILSEHAFDEPYLINKEFVDLISIGNKDVSISKAEGMLVADTQLSEKCSISVCTKIQPNVLEYNIDGITKFANLEVTSFCRIRKAEILDVLDRLSLFVSRFDDGAITLCFTPSYVEVSSMASNCVERIDVLECKDAKDLQIKINIDRLRNQLKSYNSDTVDLYYGNEICIKLVDGDITQIIALIR